MKRLQETTTNDWKQDGQISPETKKGIGKAINEISKEWILKLFHQETMLMQVVTGFANGLQRIRT
ncbi:unnamed protein product [Symbiodinium sp. CCMP2456]|nr:unnamed protein product [Symbiodinium sp. CCMP2456]